MDGAGIGVQVPRGDGAYLCVLASGSSGNCSVLAMRRGEMVRCVLIDLGLSPRRTWSLLADRGLGAHQVDACLVTHLDHDHMHAGWRRQMPGHARVMMHERHARHAGVRERDLWRVEGFDESDTIALDPELRVRPRMMSHDEDGVAAFRLDLSGELAGVNGGASLGFATDLGHIHAGLVEHFAGERDGMGPVDVLAIESNYCPAMQHNSARPEVLKRRIMGGHGHLSNQEAVSAVLQIEPREHVVLLHLSRECNCPEVVSSLHAGADYAVTIASQEVPTRWVRIGGTVRRAARFTVGDGPGAVVMGPAPGTLWHAAGLIGGGRG